MAAERRSLRRGYAWALCVLALYGALWSTRHAVGLTHPMANLRYFYYGSDPDSLTDRSLYVVFWPLYAASLLWQDWHGERTEVHWRDRRDPPPLDGSIVTQRPIKLAVIRQA